MLNIKKTGNVFYDGIVSTRHHQNKFVQCITNYSYVCQQIIFHKLEVEFLIVFNSSEHDKI